MVYHQVSDYNKFVFQTMREAYAIVTPQGFVSIGAPMMITTACSIKMRWFPFDRQTCDITFTSWAYQMSKIDLYVRESAAGTSNMIKHSQFDLIEVG